MLCYDIKFKNIKDNSDKLIKNTGSLKKLLRFRVNPYLANKYHLLQLSVIKYCECYCTIHRSKINPLTLLCLIIVIFYYGKSATPSYVMLSPTVAGRCVRRCARPCFSCRKTANCCNCAQLVMPYC